MQMQLACIQPLTFHDISVAVTKVVGSVPTARKANGNKIIAIFWGD